MDASRLTQKSQEALQSAQSLAAGYGHGEADGEHLLLALLQQEDGLAPRLFQKMDVPVASFEKRLEDTLASRPRVSGPGAEMGKIYVTQRLQRLLTTASEAAARISRFRRPSSNGTLRGSVQ